MAIEAERLIIYLDARLADYEKAMARARSGTERELRAMERRFQQTQQKIVGFGKEVLGALGVGLSVGALTSIISAAGRLADELDETSKQLGISTDHLQALRYAAVLAGTDVGELDGALNAFVRTLGDAATGNEAAADKFAALGVSLKDAEGNARSLEQILPEVADAIGRIGNETERSAAATDLFGRQGSRLVPLLQQISGGWDTVTDSARDAGQVMSAETVKALADATDSLELFKNKLIIIAGEIAEALLGLGPYFDELAQDAANLALEVLPGGRAFKSAVENAPVTMATGTLPPLSADLPPLHGQKPIITYSPAEIAAQRAAEEAAAKAAANAAASAAKSAAAAAQREAVARAEAVAALLQEIDLNERLIGSYGEGVAALDAMKARQEALNEARRLGFEEGTAEFDQFVASAERLEAQRQQLDLLAQGVALTESLRTEEQQRIDTLEELNKLREAGAITEETYRVAVEQTTEEYQRQQAAIDELQSFGERAFDRIGAAITEMFVQGKGSAFDFLDVFKGILAEMLQEMIKLAILNPLKNAIFGTSLPVFADLFSSGSSSTPSLPTGGVHGSLQGMAGGGPVRGGTPYMVGELGRELFVPERDGVIVPHAALGGAGSGTSVVVINAAPDTTSRTERSRSGGREQIKVFIEQTVAESLNRTGSAPNRVLEEFGGRRPLIRR